MLRHSRRSFVKGSGALLGGIAVGSTVTAAENTGRFIVDTKKLGGAPEGLDVVHDISEVDLAVVEGDESAVAALGVDYETDTFYRLDLPDSATPAGEDVTDEPLYSYQWDKQDQQLPEVHEISRGEGTRVAVIDSGVGSTHPDLAGTVNAGLSRNFSGDGLGAPGPWGGTHGSHVAGIIAADDRNDAGTVGTAPGTEIVDCRVFALDELASYGSVMAALVYAASIDCDVANLSLGSYPDARQGEGEFYGNVLNRVTNYVVSQGTLPVTSSGNAGADLQHDGPVRSLPTEVPGMMAVSATGPHGFGWGAPGVHKEPDTAAYYTNYGTNIIDVSAHGGGIDLSAIGTGVPWHYDQVFNTLSVPVQDSAGNIVGVQNTWGWIVGTSMAAPQVAGAAALVKSLDPGLGPQQVRQTLNRTADEKKGSAKPYHGSGALDPLAAVQDAQ